jgi:tRNA/tmRNA/rRNA uracil-C5-methylase (TrmA/RlmC/RlmD family)
MRRAANRAEPGEEEVLELTLGEPAHGGACVAREESGRVVFVRHGLPGERVRARVTSTRNTLAWAEVAEVLDPSPDRVPSVWPEAGPGGVGGGELAHVRPSAQRRWKETVLRGQLRRVGGEALLDAVTALGGVRVDPTPGDGDEADPLLGRRTRIELVVTPDGRAGMHRYRTREVVGVEEMPLAVPAIQELGLFGSDSPWGGVWRAGDRVRAVAPNGGEAVLVAPSGAWALREGRPTRVEDEPLTWTVRRPGGAPDAQETFSVRARGFWQSHVRGAETLAEAVMRASQVAEGDRVMELYSGAGLFTRFLAQAAGPAGRVASLEGDEGAVADATANLEGWPQAETFVGTVDAAGVLELAGELGAGGASEGRGSEAAADVVVLDPPRAGAGRDVCRALCSLGAPRVVLVSCDPAAGARDLRALAEGGYALESFEAWDLFPHTHHVEFVAGLTRG